MTLDQDPFDLVERDFVGGAVVELGGPWGFVAGDQLSIF